HGYDQLPGGRVLRNPLHPPVGHVHGGPVNPPTPLPRRRRSRGLGLVELLISLAITASLLTAIAAAFSSSASLIDNNDKFFRATQSGRVALHQILTEVRRCDSVQ